VPLEFKTPTTGSGRVQETARVRAGEPKLKSGVILREGATKYTSVKMESRDSHRESHRGLLPDRSRPRRL